MIECRLFSTDIGTGLAILTGNYHFFVVNNVEEARLRRFIDPPGKFIGYYENIQLNAWASDTKFLQGI